MEDEKVVISSLVVEARPESVDEVARALAATEGGGARGERVQDRRHYRGAFHGRFPEGVKPVHSGSGSAEREPCVRTSRMTLR